MNLEKIQCCDKHTVGPLFTLCPDVAWDRGSFVTTRVGPKSAGISVPAYGVTTCRRKIPRCVNFWMLHAHHTKPREDAGLSGISRPSLRSTVSTANIQMAQHVFLSDVGAICCCLLTKQIFKLKKRKEKIVEKSGEYALLGNCNLAV